MAGVGATLTGSDGAGRENPTLDPAPHPAVVADQIGCRHGCIECEVCGLEETLARERTRADNINKAWGEDRADKNAEVYALQAEVKRLLVALGKAHNRIALEGFFSKSDERLIEGQSDLLEKAEQRARAAQNCADNFERYLAAAEARADLAEAARDAAVKERDAAVSDVDHWRVKAKCYGNIVHGCSPALEAAGHPVDKSPPGGAVEGIRKSVEALVREREAAERRCGEAVKLLIEAERWEGEVHLPHAEKIRAFLRANGEDGK